VSLIGMSFLSRIPWPSHPGASCDTRERNSAMVAIGGCFLLALGVVITAMMLVPSGSDPNDDTAGTLGGGYGTGSGNGFGAGTGDGSALSGDGPGAGKKGDRHGASGTGTDSAARGQRSGTVAMANAKDGESLVAGESTEVPKFSFKIPDANEVVEPPQTTTAVGRKDGKDGEGRAGAGGGGGTEFMGVRSNARHVVYVIDFSSSMNGDRFAHTRLELKRSIERLPEDGSFLVVFFDNEFVVMPPGRLVPATARNKGLAKAWIDATDTRGGTEPSRAMAFALALNPETIFMMTDGQFDSDDAVNAVIDKENVGRRTSINTIAFHERAAEPELKKIAQENNGDYRYIPAPGETVVP